jgi:proton-translocating NADH-quinone oxidoreductase, chain M
MNTLGFPILSMLLVLPVLGAIILLLVPRENTTLQRQITLAITLASFVISWVLPITFNYNPGTIDASTPPVMQFVDQFPWIPAWGMSFALSLDGISLWLVLLTTFISFVVALVTDSMVESNKRSFLALLLFFEAMLIGVFTAQDLFLFYLFWELALLPAIFMVGVWGRENRVRAAVRFFLFTFAGSVFMLLGIAGLYILHRQATGVSTFDIAQIVTDIRSGAFELGIVNERILFGAFLAAFLVKVPIWPFHTWLPDTYSYAPTPATIMIAAVMSKMGTYGLIRFNVMLFPDTAAWAAPAIGILAVIGILYGAIAAYAQSDMKRLVAYSSISHMGFIALGIFALNPVALSGAVLQMVNHGVTTAALFLVVAAMVARKGSYQLEAYSGLWKAIPIFSAFSLVFVLASIGLPGLNGFIGEYTLMQGTMSSSFLGWGFVGFAVLGVIFAAAYMLRFFRGAFMGEVEAEGAQLAEISRNELLTFGLLLIPIVVIGLFPNLLFGAMQHSAADITGSFLQAAQAALGQ